MEKRKHIEYGYVTYTGKAMSDSAVDAYNRVQDRINAAIDGGFPVSESLLNESHFVIAQAAGCYI